MRKTLLIGVSGKHEGSKFPIDKDTFRIGRDPENDLVIDDDMISDFHAEIVRIEYEYILIDLDSMNGTFLNGKKIYKHPLSTGDKIKFDIEEFEFKSTLEIIKKEKHDEPNLIKETMHHYSSESHIKVHVKTEKISLQMITHPNPGRSFYLKENKTYTIGKNPTNDIVIADDTVSDSHASLEFKKNTFIFKDLNSMSGSMINGKAITKKVLKDKDEIKLGNIKLVFINPKIKKYSKEFGKTQRIESTQFFKSQVFKAQEEAKEKKSLIPLITVGSLVIIIVYLLFSIFKGSEPGLTPEYHTSSKEVQHKELKDKSFYISKYNLVQIPVGEFLMGSPSEVGIADEYPLHKVHLDKFYISKYEVTNKDYAEFLNDYGKDSDNNGNKMIYDSKKQLSGKYNWGLNKESNLWQPVNGYEKHPVIYVTWYGAVQYCKWLSNKTGLNFRLPTEAEWEYVCRAGNKGKWCFGDDESKLKDFAWYDKNFDSYTQTVGQKTPNAYGIYDMHGNVWEWCSDWYGKNYYSSSPGRNPKGSSSGSYRVSRGGSWRCHANNLRSALRFCSPADFSGDFLGFRSVMTIDKK